MPAGFYLLIAAQFLSALADNALLIVAIALLVEQGQPGWWAPLLKVFFTVAYVVLAPFIGVLADAVPKARLMAWMNGVKVAGVLLLAAGLDPLLAFAVVGLGAAAYAPAKYGWITEAVTPQRLVAANGWIEVSVVCAALLGALFGGLLVTGAITGSGLARASSAALVKAGGGHTALALSLLVLLAAYGAAGLLNLGIPGTGARYPRVPLRPWALTQDFIANNRKLWQDGLGGLSLSVTTLFWGAGATLQFAVLRWAEKSLGLPLDRAAALQAVVAIGVVGGAGLAGRLIALERAPRVLPAGVLLGLLVPLAAATTSLWWALPLLAAFGFAGGFLVVPMNALLQHRGHVLLTAGRSIAVQGFNENASVLAMLAVYTLLLWADVPVAAQMAGLGLFVAAVVACLIRRWRVLDATPLTAVRLGSP